VKGWDTGDERSVQRTFSVTVGKLALSALAGGTDDSAALSRSLEQAVRYYLTDRGAERAGWMYPSFLPEEGRTAGRKVRLTVEAAIWTELAEEAERQEVSVEQLLGHAALYFIADRDTGRLTQRILEDLGREEAQ
jgi:hypothetical protein